MADTGIPRMVRQNMGKEANARPVAINRQVIARGMQGASARAEHAGGGGHLGGGGGGLGRAFGGAGAGAGGEDNFLSGNFQQNPTIRLFNAFPIGGGGLSDVGKKQQADSAAIDRFVSSYQGAKQSGASDKDAFSSAWKANPDGMLAMFHHPTALRSFEGLTAVLGQATGSGAPASKYVPDLAHGTQYQIDPSTGEVIGSKPIPGGAPAAPPARFDPRNVKIGTDGKPYYGTLDAQGNPVMRPMGTGSPGSPAAGGDNVIAGSGSSGSPGSGSPAGGPTFPTPKGAGGQAAPGPLTKYSGDPIPSGGNGKHPLTQGETSYLTNSANFITDLKTVRDYANASGLVQGTVSYIGGKYTGTNDQGAMFAAALNRLGQGVYAQYGIKGSAGAKQIVGTLPTHNEAPSYVASSVTGMIQNAQNELQGNVDIAEQRLGAPLPGTLRQQMETQADVYSLSDQNNASPTWVARNFPNKLSGAQVLELSHNPNIEPSETKGLNQFLDTAQARRQSDAQAAATAPPPKSTTPDYAANPAPQQQPAQQPSQPDQQGQGQGDQSGQPQPKQPGMVAGGALPAVAGSNVGAAPQPPAPEAAPQAPEPSAAGDGGAQPVPGVSVAPDSTLGGQGALGVPAPAPTIATPTAPAPMSGQQSGSGGIGGNGGGLTLTQPGSALATPQAAPAPTVAAAPAPAPAVNPYAAALVDALGGGGT